MPYKILKMKFLGMNSECVDEVTVEIIAVTYCRCFHCVIKFSHISV
jgi:hypothetical protein